MILLGAQREANLPALDMRVAKDFTQTAIIARLGLAACYAHVRAILTKYSANSTGVRIASFFRTVGLLFSLGRE